MLALVADVVRNPSFPQAELDLLKANTAQQLQAQTASPQYREQQAVPADAVRRPSLRAHRRHAGDAAGDRSRSRSSLPADLLPSQQRLPGRGRRCRAGGGVRGGRAGVRRLGAARASRGEDGGAAGAERPHAGVRAAAQQRAVVDLGRQLHARSATIRAGTRCSWPTRSSARRSTRGWSGTSAKRRATPTRRSRSSSRWRRAGCIAPSRMCRNEVTGATLKEIYAEIDKLRAGGPEAEELSDAKQYSRGLFVLQNAIADRPWPTRSTPMNDVRAAEGLSRNVPAADLAAVGRGDQDRRTRCCSGRRIRSS